VARKKDVVERKWGWAILIAWGAQVATLVYFFANLTWENYWFCRWIYRPGLKLFSAIGRGILPDHFFSPFDRAGVLAGFAFASLLYAVALVAGTIVTRRVTARR
jgi:hypothetical protein